MRILPFFLFALLMSHQAMAADQLEISLKTVQGTGDAAMYVAWVEKTDGTFVKTVMMYSKDKKYYDHMTMWWKPHESTEGREVPDAMISPTLKWSADRTVSISTDLGGGKNILSGDYVLRFEQRKDKGGHYKKIKIPLSANMQETKVDKYGYVETFIVTIKKGN